VPAPAVRRSIGRRQSGSLDLHGGEEIGNVLLHYFFVVLGAGTVLATLVGKGPVIFLFLVILVAIHGLIIFGVGRLLKIEIEALAVASQSVRGRSIYGSCVGGHQWLEVIGDTCGAGLRCG
jgi:uncharacterized membrane protein